MEEDTKQDLKQFLKDLRVAVILIIVLLALPVVIFFAVFFIDIPVVSTVDKQTSPDEEYVLKFQTVGAPVWPYGPVDVRLVLKENWSVISKTSTEIWNDGKSLSEDDWSVTWYDDYVEVILSGEEQYDERIILYFDGQVEREELDTHYGSNNW